MLTRASLTVLSLAAFLWAGCASTDPPLTNTGGDTGTLSGADADAGRGGGGDVAFQDTGQVEKDSGPTYHPPQFYHSTSGGGLSTSSQFKLQMSFGAPMPRGNASNGQYRLRFGPVSP